MTALAGPFLKLPEPRTTAGLLIRPIEQNDVPRCLDLAELATQHCDLRLIWDRERLAWQLGLSGFSKALVAEENGEVRGCIGDHILSFYAKTLENIGIIDPMFMPELSAKARSELLNISLLRLRALGSVVALKLRIGDYPTGLFLRWGWFCKPADSLVLVTWANEHQQRPPLKRRHVLWR